MADITVKVIETYNLPVSDVPVKEYGEMNYIFYPGISEYKKIRLTNTTGGALTPVISFAPYKDIDNKWWKTMRISTTNSGVLAAGVFDLAWTGAIAAGATQDLYVYSHCTRAGFSYKYAGTYWTNVGFNILNANFINDMDVQSAAVDCDAAAVGATLVLDVGEDKAEEFVRLNFSVDAVVNAKFNIQYSDDGAAWTTVYTGADLRPARTGTSMYVITFWWDKAGAHRYWRIIKTDVAAAGGNIDDMQWQLFEAHGDAKDFGVYGDHKCYMTDSAEYMDDFEWRTSIMVSIDMFSRQNFRKPLGKIGQHSLRVVKNMEKYGQTVQLWYIPAITMTNPLNAKADFQLEKRVWNTKAMVTPQNRTLQYTMAADGLQPSLWRYDQRRVYFTPYGPDSVGWYIVNYDFWHAYGHSFYMFLDNHSYKIDDPQPIYFDDEIVAVSARAFLQSDMVNLALDPRSYKLTNREGDYSTFPSGLGSLPSNHIDLTTPEQKTMTWIGAVPTTIWGRTDTCRPNPYAIAPTLFGGFPNGEIFTTEEWENPATVNFQTFRSVIFGARVDAQATAAYFQMNRFYNWLGYVDTNGLYDIFNWVVQVFYDEDCTIPVKINQTKSGNLPKVETHFDEANVTAAGKVTLTMLGNTITTDGHNVRTPTRLYVRYRGEEGETAYYY